MEEFEFSKNKAVCFAGHRYDWHCMGIENNLLTTIEELILKGYTLFYDGNKGAFDEKCVHALFLLKKKYPYIKIIRVLTYYNHNKERNELPFFFDGSILPELEKYHYKQKVTKRNEWIVDRSDVVVCHIEQTYQSGAYNMVKYAEKNGKIILKA